MPNVTVQAGAQHDNTTDDNVANVQVSVPLPIFNRNQGAIAQACGELAAAQAALERRELALEQRLAEAMRDYATARERALKYADNVLPVARETLEIMNSGYKDGELDYLAGAIDSADVRAAESCRICRTWKRRGRSGRRLTGCWWARCRWGGVSSIAGGIHHRGHEGTEEQWDASIGLVASQIWC